MKTTMLSISLLTITPFISQAQVVPVNPDPQPFGTASKDAILDTFGIGRWWESTSTDTGFKRLRDQPRDEIIGFVLYTHDNGILKMTAQLYPLKEGESMVTYLDLDFGNGWTNVASVAATYPGWYARYRIENWDNTQDVPYRVRHKASAAFAESSYAGLIRHDPIEKDTVVMAALGCIGKNYMDDKVELVAAIQEEDPDVVFFYGDQYYVNYEHCAAWLEFGRWAKELFRNRPAIVIMDDHDYSFGNLWGAGGIESPSRGDGAGGFYWDPSYIHMIEGAMTSHLPDPYDPTPIARGIGVYYTRMRVGGIDFALLEDRKWKSGYKHPDNWIYGSDKITDPLFDTLLLDAPGLVMLGQRQLDFLDDWAQDWTRAEMKTVLSQTTFACVPHMHGSISGRQVANLDANGWPQSPRDTALRAIRRAKALHVCGDQHMASVVKYGVDEFSDAAYAFTVAATYNSIFYRLWHPLGETNGPNPRAGTTLPWTGDFLDGFQNRISMFAYANPVVAEGSTKPSKETRRDGWGVVRYHKPERQATLESWENYDKSAEARVQPSGAVAAGPIVAAIAGTTAAISRTGPTVPSGAVIVAQNLFQSTAGNRPVQWNNSTTHSLIGQSFTATADAIAEGVALKLDVAEEFGVYDAASFRLKIFQGNDSNATELGSYEYDATGLGNASIGDWIRFGLGDGVDLASGYVYSFLLVNGAENANHNTSFKRSKVAADYAAGTELRAGNNYDIANWEADPWDVVAGATQDDVDPQAGHLLFSIDGSESVVPPSTNATELVSGHWQHPGWPITIDMADNDGRTVTHVLPEMSFATADPVVQVIRESDGEILYTQRIKGNRWTPEVYSAGTYTVKVGTDRPDAQAFSGISAVPVSGDDPRTATVSM